MDIVILGAPEEVAGSPINMPAGPYSWRSAITGLVARCLVFWHETIPGIDFPTVIYPNVFVSKSSRIGRGTVLMSGAAVMANAVLGEGCIVNTGGAINHDCQLADYSSVSGGAQLGGGAIVGLRSSVGIGAVLREKTTIGRDTVVGAGAAVFRDMPDEVVVFGMPARIVKSRRPDESYMQ